MRGIKDRVHVITGGYGGIASATADTLARSGGKVIITGRDAAKGEAKARELSKATGGAVHFVALDVSDSAATDRVAMEIETTFGPVYGVVINAATARIAPTFAHSDEDWRAVMSTNLDGAFYGARAFGKLMRGRGGSIVLISSIAARTVIAPSFHAAYSASKAAISHLAAALGVEWAPESIRVNAVEPGYTATDAIEHLKRDAPEAAAGILTHLPIGRFLEPSEIADVIAFLLSDLSSAVTGTVLVADGGTSAR